MQDTSDPSSSEDPCPTRDGWWTRDNALTVVLVVATALLLYLCWLLVQPFLAPIAWALALAIIARPLHCWLVGKMEKKPGLAAGLAVALIALIIIGPTIFVGHQIVKQATNVVNTVQEAQKNGGWREQLAQRSPKLASAVATVEQNSALSEQVQGMAGAAGKKMSEAVTGSAWAVVNLLLTLFILFFLFRDRGQAERSLRSLVPLSEGETDKVMQRVSDTVHATIYGTLVVALVQGTLGGLMFWWLGLPAPILWGAVMALLALVPVLGAFVIWVPAAIYLAATGAIVKALILTVWGGVVIALIDNLLYPVLVGNRLRLHTVPVFFAIVGGLFIFGTAGLVLGPVVLALTQAVLEIWRRRTAHGKAAEEAVSNA